MKKCFLIMLLMAQVLLPGLLLAQEQLPDYHPELLPNPLEDITLKARVSRSNVGYFIYGYEIHNPPANNGKVASIDIDIQQGVGKAALRNDGLTTECYIPKDIMTAVSPVGMKSPLHWDCGVGTGKTAFWGAHDHPYLLLPGQSLSGMVLTSYGLPGIRDVKVIPLIVDSIYPSIEEYDVDMDELHKVMDQDEERVSYHSRTIGPTAPPANFNPIEFLDYIASLKKDAYYQSWIIQKSRNKDKDKDAKKGEKNKEDDKEIGIMSSLDKKLNHVRVVLVKGDTREAIEKLKSFTYEVAALYKEGKEERESHITSEAFALLYYNTQYLIDQLSGEKKGHREKKEDKERGDAR